MCERKWEWVTEERGIKINVRKGKLNQFLINTRCITSTWLNVPTLIFFSIFIILLNKHAFQTYQTSEFRWRRVVSVFKQTTSIDTWGISMVSMETSPLRWRPQTSFQPHHLMIGADTCTQRGWNKEFSEEGQRMITVLFHEQEHNHCVTVFLSECCKIQVRIYKLRTQCNKN